MGRKPLIPFEELTPEEQEKRIRRRGYSTKHRRGKQEEINKKAREKRAENPPEKDGRNNLTT